MTNKFEKQRRSFLQGSVLAGAAAGASLPVGASLQPVFDKVQKAEFPMPDFKAVAGESVSIRSADGQSYRAKLVEVQEMNFQCQHHQRPAYLRDCSVVARFEVSSIESFSDDVYQLSHDKLGKMDVLFSVVPDTTGKLALEAVFN